MTEELKPCPFCACYPETWSISDEPYKGYGQYGIECQNLVCGVSLVSNYHDEHTPDQKEEIQKILIRRWNTRATDAHTMPLILGKDDDAKIIPLNQWVSVKDDLPPVGKEVWCYSKKDGQIGAKRIDSKICADPEKHDKILFDDGNYISYCDDVTHWMPLPEEPKR